MSRCIAPHIYLLTGFFLLGASSSASGSGPAVDVMLSSPKQHYVIGEPIILDVQVTNRGQQPIEAYKVTAIDYPICPEIAIYISSKEFAPAPCDDSDVLRKADTLGPGENWKYELRIAYGDAATHQLPLPMEGEYTIQVEYPLLVAQSGTFGAIDAAQSGRFKSNTVKVRVSRAVGEDARVWETLKAPGFRFFMQWGAVTDKYSDIPLRVAELLNSEPKSSFHDDLRWALKRYYHDRKVELSEHEAQLFRDVAGLAAPVPAPIVLADDARLDQIITYHFPDQTPLKEVLQKAARQSRVSLEVHPDLHRRTMASARRTVPLRTFMEGLATSGAHWNHKGEGYILTPHNALREEVK